MSLRLAGPQRSTLAFQRMCASAMSALWLSLGSATQRTLRDLRLALIRLTSRVSRRALLYSCTISYLGVE
eukprot:scaffold48434_cov34-Tisochrysis_lutea.AAC.2